MAATERSSAAYVSCFTPSSRAIVAVAMPSRIRCRAKSRPVMGAVGAVEISMRHLPLETSKTESEPTPESKDARTPDSTHQKSRTARPFCQWFARNMLQSVCTLVRAHRSPRRARALLADRLEVVGGVRFRPAPRFGIGQIHRLHVR